MYTGIYDITDLKGYFPDHLKFTLECSDEGLGCGCIPYAYMSCGKCGDQEYLYDSKTAQEVFEVMVVFKKEHEHRE